ncbi:MAG: hypothetical protein AAGA45_08305, partial [Verrucomicrobiota bacterium]
NGEYSPTFDPQTNELYFMRRTPGQFDYTVYRTALTDDGWTTPVIAPFSGTYRDAAPHLSPDGQRLYFDSRRPDKHVTEGSINIWYTEREGKGWSSPCLVKEASINDVNEPKTGVDEFGPAVDAAGQLYFYSFRQPYRGGKPYYLTSAEEPRLVRDDDLPDPSASTFISYLYISPDGKLAIMEGQAHGRRDTDLFFARKQANGSWSAVWEVPQVNTRASEGGPYLTPDGQHLLFVSDRSTPDNRAATANLYVIPAQDLFD